MSPLIEEVWSMVYRVQNDHQDEEENDKKVSIRHTHECVHTHKHSLPLSFSPLADLLILMKATRPLWPSWLLFLTVSFQQAITEGSLNLSLWVKHTHFHIYTHTQNNDRWHIKQAWLFYTSLHSSSCRLFPGQIVKFEVKLHLDGRLTSLLL